MIFFGWGARSLDATISAAQVLRLRYRYFHLFFLLQLAFGSSYSLLTLTEHGWAEARLTKEQAAQLSGGTAPHPPAWRRFGLLAAIVVLALVLLFRAALK